MQSTFPGADIGRSSPLRAMPYRVMVAHFPARKNETFGRRCQRSLFFPILEIGRRYGQSNRGGCTDENDREKKAEDVSVPDAFVGSAFGRMSFAASGKQGRAKE